MKHDVLRNILHLLRPVDLNRIGTNTRPNPAKCRPVPHLEQDNIHRDNTLQLTVNRDQIYRDSQVAHLEQDNIHKVIHRTNIQRDKTGSKVIRTVTILGDKAINNARHNQLG